MPQDTVERQSGEVLERLFDVRDRRVLVTGAASGLGFAFAEVLAECGARVMLTDADAGLLEESARSLADRGLYVRSQVVDVSNTDQVVAAVDRVIEDEGGLDVVFANAGIAGSPGFAIRGGETIDAIEPGTLDAVMAVNFHGALQTIGSAARVMKRQRSGRIVVTSSVAGLQAEPFACYGYVASNAAILNVVRQAALELAPYNVLINAICPGPFKGTRIGGAATLDVDEETERMWSATVPLGRMAEAEELKGAHHGVPRPSGSPDRRRRVSLRGVGSGKHCLRVPRLSRALGHPHPTVRARPARPTSTRPGRVAPAPPTGPAAAAAVPAQRLAGGQGRDALQTTDRAAWVSAATEAEAALDLPIPVADGHHAS